MNIRQCKNIWAELGIDEAVVEACKLAFQIEAKDLVSAGFDIFDREQFVTQETLIHWQKMKTAAGREGVELSLVSAFRSVEYQHQLILKKLESGLSIKEIIKVSAIPGFSEHHTGRALDLTTAESEPLEEEFDSTEAFSWLSVHASSYHFAMSYPKDNPYDMIYEPWHWAYKVNK